MIYMWLGYEPIRQDVLLEKTSCKDAQEAIKHIQDVWGHGDVCAFVVGSDVILAARWSSHRGEATALFVGEDDLQRLYHDDETHHLLTDIYQWLGIEAQGAFGLRCVADPFPEWGPGLARDALMFRYNRRNQ